MCTPNYLKEMLHINYPGINLHTKKTITLNALLINTRAYFLHHPCIKEEGEEEETG